MNCPVSDLYLSSAGFFRAPSDLPPSGGWQKTSSASWLFSVPVPEPLNPFPSNYFFCDAHPPRTRFSYSGTLLPRGFILATRPCLALFPPGISAPFQRYNLAQIGFSSHVRASGKRGIVHGRSQAFPFLLFYGSPVLTKPSTSREIRIVPIDLFS